MKKIGNTQSDTLLVEMSDAEYEKLTAGVVREAEEPEGVKCHSLCDIIYT